MRFGIVTLGSAGDVLPMVGLGAALRGRGHQVAVLASPAFQPAVERAGLGYVPLGTRQEYEDAIHDPDIWHPRKGFGVVARRLILA